MTPGFISKYVERRGYDEEEGDDDQEPHPKGVGNNDGQVVRDLLHSYNNHEDMEPKKNYLW